MDKIDFLKCCPDTYYPSPSIRYLVGSGSIDAVGHSPAGSVYPENQAKFQEIEVDLGTMTASRTSGNPSDWTLTQNTNDVYERPAQADWAAAPISLKNGTRVEDYVNIAGTSRRTTTWVNNAQTVVIDPSETYESFDLTNLWDYTSVSGGEYIEHQKPHYFGGLTVTTTGSGTKTYKGMVTLSDLEDEFIAEEANLVKSEAGSGSAYSIPTYITHDGTLYDGVEGTPSIINSLLVSACDARFRIPSDFVGTYHNIEYQIYNQITDPDTNLVTYESVSISSVEWTGPGSGAQSDDSWHTPYITLVPPSDPTKKQFIQILRFKIRHSEAWRFVNDAY